MKPPALADWLFTRLAPRHPRSEAFAPPLPFAATDRWCDIMTTPRCAIANRPETVYDGCTSLEKCRQPTEVSDDSYR